MNLNFLLSSSAFLHRRRLSLPSRFSSLSCAQQMNWLLRHEADDNRAARLITTPLSRRLVTFTLCQARALSNRANTHDSSHPKKKQHRRVVSHIVELTHKRRLNAVARSIRLLKKLSTCRRRSSHVFNQLTPISARLMTVVARSREWNWPNARQWRLISFAFFLSTTQWRIWCGRHQSYGEREHKQATAWPITTNRDVVYKLDSERQDKHHWLHANVMSETTKWIKIFHLHKTQYYT